eukprot:gb/GECH01012689.1/.p1 GENE.gb/GECH01012689.1/~~gb/GECH01012689.1/.p1  ORF type:complete len:392 (+),score=69.23 gb/GECH01012689.1/:1-1176(+)
MSYQKITRSKGSFPCLCCCRCRYYYPDSITKTVIVWTIYLACCLLCVGILFVIAGWLGVGFYSYDAMFKISGRSSCDQEEYANTVFNYTLSIHDCPRWHNVSFEPYHVPEDGLVEWEDVEFKPRDNDWDGTLRGRYFIAANNTVADPTIIVVEGLRSCWRRWASMIPISMFINAGFNVLGMDLRNHGDSDTQNGYTTYGWQEHKDMLGGWDYLLERFGDQGLNASKIGLHGSSMGAATTLIAFGEEPRVAAASADSAPFLVKRTLQEAADGTMGMSGSFLFSLACSVGKARSRFGCPTYPVNPEGSVAKIGDRPLLLSHTNSDTVVGNWNTKECRRVAEDSGATVNVFTGDSGGDPSVLDNPGCDDHLVLMLADPEGFRNATVGFFSEHLF